MSTFDSFLLTTVCTIIFAIPITILMKQHKYFWASCVSIVLIVILCVIAKKYNWNSSILHTGSTSSATVKDSDITNGFSNSEDASTEKFSIFEERAEANGDKYELAEKPELYTEENSQEVAGITTLSGDMNDGSSITRAKKLATDTAISDSLKSNKDVLWYEMTLEEPGTVSFNMQYSAQKISSNYWELYVYKNDVNSDHIMKYSYNGNGNGLTDTVSVDSTLLGIEAGKYYIRIKAGAYHSSTPYTLTAKYTATEQCEMEPNDSYGTASVIQPNASYTGSLLTNKDVDWYLLTLDNSGTVSFNMQYSAQKISSNYWELYVYKNDVNSDYIMKYSYNGNGTGLTDTVSVDSTLLGIEAGQYYIRIKAGAYHSSTPYTLTAKYTATEQCEMEPNDSCDTASTLKPNVSYIGNLMTNRDVDWYLLTLDKSSTVSFNMQYSAKQYSSSYWELYVYKNDVNSGHIMKYSYKGDGNGLSNTMSVDSTLLELEAGQYYIRIIAGSYHIPTLYTLTANVLETAQ